MGVRLVGARARRVEDPRLLRGQGAFVDDVELPGVLALAVLRSPHPHAGVRSVDLTAALALPGVVDAFTADALGPDPMPIPALDPPPDGVESPQHPLALDTVRYVGEGVAVVVAESRAVAEDALELIEVQYEPRPPVPDVAAATAPGAPALHAAAPDNVVARFAYGTGDADAAFAAADRVLGERLDMQRYTGIPLETRGVAAAVEPMTGDLTIWASTQWPHTLRRVLAALLGRPERTLRVITPDVGGGFGTKADVYPEDVLVPLAVLRCGRPVKWIEDRREHFLTLVHSREQTHDVELAFAADGRITGLRARLITDIGAYQRTLSTVTSMVSGACLSGPYDIPNVHVEVRCVTTNKSPAAPYRGAGAPEVCFARERLLDIAARELGFDRARLRRINLIRPELMPFDTGLEAFGAPVVLDGGDFPAVLDTALRAADYPGFAATQRAARAAGRLLGLGIAVYHQMTGTGLFEGATVRVDPVFVTAGSAPQGQGTATVLAQLVADQLQVDYARIRCVLGDTGRLEFGAGTFASRSTVMAGSAVHLAAVAVRERALRLAGHLLEVDVADLELAEGRVKVKGTPQPARSLAELAAAAAPGAGPRPDGMEPGLAATQYYENAATPFAFGVHVAQVEVEPATGQVTVTRYVVAHDAGVLINPLLAEGQIAGGVAQGIGGALMEELRYAPDGQPLCTGFQDYPVPGSRDVPSIEIAHRSSPSPLNPLGVKGMGEGGAIGGHAAVANAVADAVEHLEVRVRRTPLTPSVVWELLRSADS